MGIRHIKPKGRREWHRFIGFAEADMRREKRHWFNFKTGVWQEGPDSGTATCMWAGRTKRAFHRFLRRLAKQGRNDGVVLRLCSRFVGGDELVGKVGKMKLSKFQIRALEIISSNTVNNLTRHGIKFTVLMSLQRAWLIEMKTPRDSVVPRYELTEYGKKALEKYKVD